MGLVCLCKYMAAAGRGLWLQPPINCKLQIACLGGTEDRIRSDTMPQDLFFPIANYTICKELQSDDINSSPLTFWLKSFLGLALRGV